MKRKEKLANVEKDRFNKNMAQMMAPAVNAHGSHDMAEVEDIQGSSRNKWAALRGFIQQTMEHRPDASA